MTLESLFQKTKEKRKKGMKVTNESKKGAKDEDKNEIISRGFLPDLHQYIQTY